MSAPRSISTPSSAASLPTVRRLYPSWPSAPNRRAHYAISSPCSSRRKWPRAQTGSNAVSVAPLPF